MGVIHYLIQPFRFIRHIIYVIERKITKPSYLKLKVMSDFDTIERILDGYSIARYGDGEFQWMLGENNNSFQDSSIELKNKLTEVFNSTSDKFLVCITNAFTNLDKFSYDDMIYWQLFLKKNWNSYEKLFDMKKVYGNANISRPYMLYNRFEKKKAKERFENLKKIWDNKKILIIEGEKTRLGVGNDLLDNSRNIKRILCPSKNAFACYSKIIDFVKKIDYKPDMILLALGPTATILAYDLHKLGFQSIDIGHIDIEYEWFLNSAKRRIPIDGKYVNECYNEKSINCNIKDIKYDESILGVISYDNKN